MNDRQLTVLKKNNEESREFTRSCISFAFVTLLNKEIDYKDLTVTKLCAVAGVSRAAFYRNYKTVDDVLNDKIKEVAYKLSSLIESDIYNNWLNIFNCVEKNKLLFKTLIKAECEHKILEVFLSLVPEDEDSRTIQTIWVSIIYSMIIKWFKEDVAGKIEDMAMLAYRYTKNIPLVTDTD